MPIILADFFWKFYYFNVINLKEGEMSISTKGFLYAENKKNFTIEKLVELLRSKFDGVKLRKTHIDNYLIIMFYDDDDSYRVLSVFTQYESYKYEGYPELNDDYIILFDLGLWGNSLKIITDILKSFGGGYIVENDCNDDWEIVAGKCIRKLSVII